jgi:3-oxoacyl-[acyl-carrier-protein] synthase-1
MTTAVGLTAEASCAAIRARLDGFHETRFAARASGWIVGAEAPLEQPWRGLSRLAQLAA